mmetsp:Transcript_44017/g.115650  ORF Transcript_44017/g.115650 Transcript_44017/m.115650 type:complete len:206 (+) Transcript_44017:136-753(+)
MAHDEASGLSTCALRSRRPSGETTSPGVHPSQFQQLVAVRRALECEDVIRCIAWHIHISIDAFSFALSCHACANAVRHAHPRLDLAIEHDIGLLVRGMRRRERMFQYLYRPYHEPAYVLTVSKVKCQWPSEVLQHQRAYRNLKKLVGTHRMPVVRMACPFLWMHDESPDSIWNVCVCGKRTNEPGCACSTRVAFGDATREYVSSK